LPGVLSIQYVPEADHFILIYQPDRIRLVDLFSAIWEAGRRQGREFIPRVSSVQPTPGQS